MPSSFEQQLVIKDVELSRRLDQLTLQLAALIRDVTLLREDLAALHLHVDDVKLDTLHQIAQHEHTGRGGSRTRPKD